MNFTAEELRRLWLDLYRDEVARLASARASLHPDDAHDLASEHAETHLVRLAPGMWSQSGKAGLP